MYNYWYISVYLFIFYFLFYFIIYLFNSYFGNHLSLTPFHQDALGTIAVNLCIYGDWVIKLWIFLSDFDLLKLENDLVYRFIQGSNKFHIFMKLEDLLKYNVYIIKQG